MPIAIATTVASAIAMTFILGVMLAVVVLKKVNSISWPCPALLWRLGCLQARVLGF